MEVFKLLAHVWVGFAQRRFAANCLLLGCLLSASGCGQAQDDAAQAPQHDVASEQTLPPPSYGINDDVQYFPAGPEFKQSHETAPAVSESVPPPVAAPSPATLPPWRRSVSSSATASSDVAQPSAVTAPVAVQPAVPVPAVEATARAASPLEPYVPAGGAAPAPVSQPAPVTAAPSPAPKLDAGLLMNRLLPGASNSSSSSTGSNPLMRSSLAPTTSSTAKSTAAPASAAPDYSTAPSLTGPASAGSSPSLPAPLTMSAPATLSSPAPVTSAAPPAMSMMVENNQPSGGSFPAAEAVAAEPMLAPPALAAPAPAEPEESLARSMLAPARAGSADASTSPEAAAADGNENGYRTVKVFYGTDRAQVDLKGGSWTMYLSKFYLPAGILAAAGLLLLIARLGVWKRLTQPLAWCAAIASIVLCCMAGLSALRMQQTAAKPGVHYGGQRGSLELGFCEVSIPPDHQVGELEAPTIFKLEVREDVNKHVVLMGAYPQEAESFFGELKQKVDSSPQKNAFVFVHGFNTGFEEAARRTAQMAHDLKFSGAPIFYSWPSQATLTSYTIDENNVEWTVPHLRQFLDDVANQRGAKSICLIAHSMGNRALTRALQSMSYRMNDPVFSEVVLTAPDIDADVFRRDIAPAVARTARRVTLYASSNDEALRLSKSIHGYPRAGDSGGLLVVVPGIETIDVSAVDTSLVGHSYYSSSGSVVSDLICLLNNATPAAQRTGLIAREYNGLPYWVFAVSTAAANAATRQ